MSDFFSDLFSELKRRNVFRVGVAYVAIAWVLAQVAELGLDSFGAPEWVMKTLLLLLALGFPLALFFAWAFELTPDGLKREADVDRSSSISRRTGRKLDFVIISVLAVAVALLLADRMIRPAGEPGQAPALTQSDTEAPATENSIAVLPFVDMSPNQDQEYFTDGLTENLLHALAQIRELKVAGRTSSFAFKGRNEDLREIGRQLDVSSILEGSVQKAGERVRITAQLVNVSDGFHLWSETFDRNLDDIFAVQDEIAGAVARALRSNLLGGNEIDSGYHGSFAAYNAYLQGRALANLGNFEGWEKAIEQYRKAIDSDPGMALAWAGMSETIADRTGYTSEFAAGYEQARKAARQALDLDPKLPEAHLALATIQQAHDWDWQAVEQSLRRALSLRPGDPDIRARLGELLILRGEFNRALELLEDALAQDPLNVGVQSKRIWLLLALDRNDEALEGALHLMALHPHRGGNGTLLAAAYYEAGNAEKALDAGRREVFPFLQLTNEAAYLHDLGDQPAAQAALARLINEFGDNVSYQVAAVNAHMGNLDAAFAALDRGFEIRDPGLVWIQAHTIFDPLRDDPRYDAFLKKMGFR